MTKLRICDFDECESKPTKILGVRGTRWGSSYEDEIELCQKHYVYVLEWFYTQSTGQHISEILKQERGKE